MFGAGAVLNQGLGTGRPYRPYSKPWVDSVSSDQMRLPKITRKPAWLPVLAGLLLCGTAYRILAAGGAKGTSTSTSSNLRQPLANTNGLLAWYPLDGDAKDYSGNYYDGTLTNFTLDGTTNGWTGGKFGKGLLFSATSNAYVSAPALASYPSGVTYSAWININLHGQNGEGRTLFSQNRNGYLNVSSIGGSIRLETCGACAGQQDLNSSYNLTDTGSWVHVAATYSPSTTTGQIYINGKLNAQSTNMANTMPNSPTVQIGSSDFYNPYSSFAMDDVRIYNRVLSATEIANLYAGSPSQNCDQTCKVWLKFDDNAGTSATDSAGTHPGTLNRTATWTTGNFASAVQLDGSTGYVSVPDLGMASGTLDMWINPTSVSGDQRLFAQASGSSAQAGQIALNQTSGENGSLWTWDGTAWQRLAPDGTVKAGQWNQIVVANNGGTATAFVNGVQQLTAASAFAFSGVPANVGGKFLGTAGGTFNGSVDDFRIYSRFLAPEEVADQWRQGT